MERLTLIEHDADHAMHPRVFEALTRGSALQQLRDWLDRLLPEGPNPATRLSLHPQPRQSIVLARTAMGWAITTLHAGKTASMFGFDTFTEAAADFVSAAGRDGDHWSEVDAPPRIGERLLLDRSTQVVAWVRYAASRIDDLTSRLTATSVGVQAAIDALQADDPVRALAALAGSRGGAPALLGTLTALADLLDQVEGDDPPSYVTALEAHARAVIVAAGLRPARREAEAEPIAA